MITGNMNLLAQCLVRYIHRRDIYARQLDNGSYVCIQKPFSTRHLVVHMQGKITLGTYTLDKKSKTSYLVFDADDDGQWEQLIQVCQSLAHHGVPSYLELSRRGGHLWLFFEEMVSGRDALLLATGSRRPMHFPQWRCFQKQNQLSKGPGSLIRLPFGVHRKSGKMLTVSSQTGQDLAETLEEQIVLLAQAKTVSEAAMDEFWRIGYLFRQQSRKGRNMREPNKGETSLTTKIKASISTIDFISLYVKLSSTGRGLCPFHDDENASFSVNKKNNYWKCFAGCGGKHH